MAETEGKPFSLLNNYCRCFYTFIPYLYPNAAKKFFKQATIYHYIRNHIQMPAPLSLKDLNKVIQACIQQDPKYQKLLYETYYGYALKIVFRYIYRYDKAVDVVNDGFVKLFKHFSRFTADNDESLEPKLMGWIRKIMINNAIDALRKNEMIMESGNIPESVWEQTDKANNADQLILYKEIIIQIKKLPPMYRAVFNMYVIDGLSHQQIADALEISVGTSKSNLWKARNLLQKYINGQEELEAC